MPRGLHAALMAALAVSAVAYEIKTPVDAKPWEKTAAEELNAYLTRMMDGASVKVCGGEAVFHVGDTQFAKSKGMGNESFRDEEWAVKSFGPDVVLAGGGTRGTLYAVSHFLEDECGVRWWCDDDEDVPSAKPLAFEAFNRRGRPYFRRRDVFRNRHPSLRRLEALNRLNCASAGPMPAAWGGGFAYGPPYFCHTFERMMPFEKYGAEHPEWYSLYEGKRTGAGASAGQPCMSNSDVKKLMSERLLANIEYGRRLAKKAGLPAPTVYDLSQNDSRKFCECENCKAEIAKKGLSGYVIDFVKEISAPAVAKYNDLKFSTLAYSRTEPLPADGVTLPDNLIVTLCNTKQNMAAGITEQSNKTIRDLVQNWSRLAKELFVWEYVRTYGKFGEGFPLPNEFYLAERFRFYAEHGVTGLLVEFEMNPGQPELQDIYVLKFYLISRLLEDPFQDGDVLIERFMRDYYGPAGDKVLAARRHLDRIRRDRGGNVFWFPFVADFDFIKIEDIKTMETLFDEAAAAVANDPKRRRRVTEARTSLERIKGFLDDGGGLSPPEPGVADVPFYEFPVTERNFKRWGTAIMSQDPDIGDPNAGGANIVRIPVDGDDSLLGLPFLIGLYDQGVKKTVKSVTFAKPIGEGYQWYDLPDVTIPERASYVYFTRSWRVQEYLTNAEIRGKLVDVRALVKFQGPKFFPGSMPPNEIRIARVIFVPK